MENNIRLRKLGHIQALLETIIEMGDNGAPSGICYMAMSMQGVDIHTYESYVHGLVNAGLITSKAHVLHATAKTRALLAPTQ